MSNQQAVCSERKEKIVSEKLFFRENSRDSGNCESEFCIESFAAITKLSHLILGCGAV